MPVRPIRKRARRSRAALAACWITLLAAHAIAQKTSPGITITPSEPVILGEPVEVKITGLAAGGRATVTAELVRSSGKLWRSTAVFISSAAGEIDPGLQAPESGSWSGVDPYGLFWSMEETEEAPEDWPGDPEIESVIRIGVEVGGEEVAHALHRRWLRAPGVQATEVRDEGLVATLFTPPGGSPAPAVIIVSGSGGGISGQELQGSVLASHGLAVLALAYFRMEGLPQTLADIPLEYFEKAIAWLGAHPRVDGERLAIMGGSKGAELALLVGSRAPRIKAVVAAAPSSVLWASLPLGQTSSWSLAGEPTPYVPYVIPEEFQRTGLLVHLYNASLDAEGWPEEAVIPVEKIGGSVLLISGGGDAMWDSQRMANDVMARLDRLGHGFDSNHLNFPDAGHWVSGPGYRPARVIPRIGGTSPGSARAQAESWQAAVAFLKRNQLEEKRD